MSVISAHRPARRPPGAAVSAACCGAEASGFDTSRALFETVVSFLDGAEAAALSHAELARLSDDHAVWQVFRLSG